MRKFGTIFMSHVEAMPLMSTQKSVIRDRYVDIIEKEKFAYYRAALIYRICKSIITLGSVIAIVLASVSDNVSLSAKQKTILVWVIVIFNALNVGANQMLSNGLSKKYILTEAILEKLKSEGWSFISGTRTYEQIEDITERYKLFCNRIEKIKLKSIESMSAVENNQASSILGTAADSKESPVTENPINRSKVILGVNVLEDDDEQPPAESDALSEYSHESNVSSHRRSQSDYTDNDE